MKKSEMLLEAFMSQYQKQIEEAEVKAKINEIDYIRGSYEGMELAYKSAYRALEEIKKAYEEERMVEHEQSRVDYLELHQ